ncbi:MAG TPA: thioredoxin family protein [Cytophagales bacterium]|jgi:peroxiredoxin
MKKLLLFSAILVWLGASVSQAQSGGYKVGDKAADFSLKNVDGANVSMAANAGAKGYLVVFTANTCPFAQAYEGRLVALHHKYAPQGYPVIAINANDPGTSPGDTYEKTQERVKQKAFPFPYLTDASQEVARAFGAARTPQVFILTRQNGGFVVQYAGAIDDNSQNPDDVNQRYVEDAMTAVLAGKPVPTPVTKSTGCTVKWKSS